MYRHRVPAEIGRGQPNHMEHVKCKWINELENTQVGQGSESKRQVATYPRKVEEQLLWLSGRE